MFAGRQLEDDTSLTAAGVQDASTMYILMRLLGGAKKRKKKTYTKPKKQKHKHKKIKLAVLKFYKVSHVVPAALLSHEVTLCCSLALLANLLQVALAKCVDV